MVVDERKRKKKRRMTGVIKKGQIKEGCDNKMGSSGGEGEKKTGIEGK